jgi:hypothetical protein
VDECVSRCFRRFPITPDLQKSRNEFFASIVGLWVEYLEGISLSSPASGPDGQHNRRRWMHKSSFNDATRPILQDPENWQRNLDPAKCRLPVNG